MPKGQGYDRIPQEASSDNQGEAYYSSLSSEKNTSDSADSSSGREQRDTRRKHSRQDSSSELSDTSSSGGKESETSSDTDQTHNAKLATRESSVTEQEHAYSRQVKRARGQAKEVSEPSSNPSSERSSDSQAQQDSSGNAEGSTDSSDTGDGKASKSSPIQGKTSNAHGSSAAPLTSTKKSSKSNKGVDDDSEETPPELRAKREYNRVSAARSRDKRKQALVRLKEHVDSATVEFEELQQTNDALREEVSLLVHDALSQVGEVLKEDAVGESHEPGSNGGLSAPSHAQLPIQSALPIEVQALMSQHAPPSTDHDTFLHLLQQLQKQYNS